MTHCFLFLAQQETGEMPGLCQLQPPQTQHHPWCRRQGKTVLPGRSTNKIYFTYHNSTSMTVAKNPPVGKSYCPQLQELAHQDFFQQYLFGITPKRVLGDDLGEEDSLVSFAQHGAVR